MTRLPIRFGALALAALAASFAAVPSAEAGTKRCVYMAHDQTGKMIADGWADAFKLDKACDRARRRCNRELERKRRKGKVGRGGCSRMSNW